VQIGEDLQALSQGGEDHLRLIIDTIPAMAWSLTPEGVVDFVNQRWLDYTGLSREQAIEGPTRTMHPQDVPAAIEKWLEHKAAGTAFEDELRLRRADGEYRWFLIRTVPLRDKQGSIIKWYGTSTDIEDHKRASDALRESGVQLQALTRRLVELQESERKDLARELHDRVGQTLTALNINLAILADGLSRDDAGMRSRVQDSAALVKAAMQTIGNVASDLHPPMLDEYGLRPALGWYAEQFSARTGIAVSVRADPPEARAAADVEIALFRIAQEALNNVAKHAGAKTVVIALECPGADYVMSVRDDGVGFGAVEGPSEPHPKLGMVTMRERAQAVGGRLRMEALPGRGTLLTVTVPKSSGLAAP
jgi:two-component system sensor histidine kinase UhpB